VIKNLKKKCTVIHKKGALFMQPTYTTYDKECLTDRSYPYLFHSPEWFISQTTRQILMKFGMGDPLKSSAILQ